MAQPAGARCTIVAGLAALGFFLGITTGAYAEPVTACGETFTTDAFLASDLDCSGIDGPSVALVAADLDLAGFTLTGGNDEAVRCTGRCRIYSSSSGEGTITGAGSGAIEADDRLDAENVAILANATPGSAAVVSVLGSASLRNVRVENNAGAGVAASGARLVVEDSVISANVGHGIQVGSTLGLTKHKLIVKRSTISDNVFVPFGGSGIHAENARVLVVDSDITGNERYGIDLDSAGLRMERTSIHSNGLDGVGGTSPDRRTVKIDDCDVSGNGGSGVRARKLKVRDSSLDGNGGVGAWADRSLLLRDSTAAGNEVGAGANQRVKVQGSSIQGSLASGVEVRDGRILVKDSTVVDNDNDPGSCSPFLVKCADLVVYFDGRVTVTNGTCETSWHDQAQESFGVCALD